MKSFTFGKAEGIVFHQNIVVKDKHKLLSVKSRSPRIKSVVVVGFNNLATCFCVTQVDKAYLSCTFTPE
jgi:hypothetical protein